MSIIDKDLNNIDMDMETLKDIMSYDIDYDKSVKNNKELTLKYKHIIKGLGFNNFNDLYTYCLLKDNSKENNSIIKKINRDNDILTVYLPINSHNQVEKDYGNVSIANTSSTMNGNICSIPNIYKLKYDLEKLDNTYVDVSTFNTQCDLYKTYYIRDNIVAISGYNYNTDYIEIVDYTGHNTVKSVGIRTIKDALDIAKKNYLGVRIRKNISKTGSDFLLSLGFTQKGNYYVMEKDYISKWV